MPLSSPLPFPSTPISLANLWRPKAFSRFLLDMSPTSRMVKVRYDTCCARLRSNSTQTDVITMSVIGEVPLLDPSAFRLSLTQYIRARSSWIAPQIIPLHDFIHTFIMDKASSVTAAFTAGKLPSTQQCNAFIDWLNDVGVTQVEPSANSELSTRGRVLANDIRQTLDAYKTFLNNKNGDNILQEALWHLTEGELSTTQEAEGEKDEAKADIDALRRSLRTLISIVWDSLSSEGTSIFHDLMSLLRLSLADAAELIEEQAGAAKESLRSVEDEVQAASAIPLDEDRINNALYKIAERAQNDETHILISRSMTRFLMLSMRRILPKASALKSQSKRTRDPPPAETAPPDGPPRDDPPGSTPTDTAPPDIPPDTPPPEVEVPPGSEAPPPDTSPPDTSPELPPNPSPEGPLPSETPEGDGPPPGGTITVVTVAPVSTPASSSSLATPVTTPSRYTSSGPYGHMGAVEKRNLDPDEHLVPPELTTGLAPTVVFTGTSWVQTTLDHPLTTTYTTQSTFTNDDQSASTTNIPVTTVISPGTVVIRHNVEVARKSNKVAIISGTVGGIAILILIGIAVFFALRRQRRREDSPDPSVAQQPTRSRHPGLLPPLLFERTEHAEDQEQDQIRTPAAGSASIAQRSFTQCIAQAEGNASIVVPDNDLYDPSAPVLAETQNRSPPALESGETSTPRPNHARPHHQPSWSLGSGTGLVLPLRMNTTPEEEERKNPFSNSNQVILGPAGVYIHQDGGSVPDLGHRASRSGVSNRSSPPPYAEQRVSSSLI
ncbi:hypothetical protein NMY22_g1050 [Coprinellus aureogranulatus]|nr:hypothetical protein NMY22_g1050 [Coprinellus aureogranulatus]